MISDITICWEIWYAQKKTKKIVHSVQQENVIQNKRLLC